MYINNLPLSGLVSYYGGAWRNPATGRPLTLTKSEYYTHYLLVMVTAPPLQPRPLHKHGSHLSSSPSPPSIISPSCFCLSVHFLIRPFSSGLFCLTLSFFFPSSLCIFELACLSHFTMKSAVWLDDWCTRWRQAKIPQLRRNCKKIRIKKQILEHAEPLFSFIAPYLSSSLPTARRSHSN